MSRPTYIPWTDAEVAFVREARARAATVPEIAAALGRSVGSVQNLIQRAGIDRRAGALPPDRPLPPLPPPPAPLEAPAPVDPVEAERERQARVKALREERAALRDVAGERSLRAMLEALFRDIVPTVPPAPKYRPPPAPRAGRVQEVALLMWSDWHFGEVVESERVRGLNAYDQDIAAQRVRGVVDTARGILTRLRSGGHEFPRAVLAVNGDLVTGSIHDLERHANGQTITESVVACGTLLAESIRNVAGDFEAVDVFCTVGNHGRLPDARRMEQKAPTRNWDWLVYRFAEAALRDVPNVTLTIPDAYAVGYDLAGWRFLQQHGHEVKSWAGIPWYGIERFVSRITALEAARHAAPHVHLLGHFHTATSLPHATGETFINGSLVGGTEFSVNALGKADRPCQWLLGVHAEHGVTHRWPVYAPAGAPTCRP